MTVSMIQRANQNYSTTQLKTLNPPLSENILLFSSPKTGQASVLSKLLNVGAPSNSVTSNMCFKKFIIILLITNLADIIPSSS